VEADTVVSSVQSYLSKMFVNKNASSPEYSTSAQIATDYSHFTSLAFLVGT